MIIKTDESKILIGIIYNLFAFCLCIYQVFLNPDPASLPASKLIKYVAELVAISFGTYYFCHCSEILDDCNTRLRKSLMRSDWHRCAPSVRRNVYLILLRAQRPNHLKLYHNSLVISKRYFLQLLKLAYKALSFVYSTRTRLN